MDCPCPSKLTAAETKASPRPTVATPSSTSGARYIQSLLLANPLYFYYQHLTPPDYFSGLLKTLASTHESTTIRASEARTPGKKHGAHALTGPKTKKSRGEVPPSPSTSDSSEEFERNLKQSPRQSEEVVERERVK